MAYLNLRCVRAMAVALVKNCTGLVRKPLVLPKPPYASSGQTDRPATIAYEFQIKMKITGQARLRGLRLHGTLRDKALYDGIA